MNPFGLKSAPYLITLIVSALGWLLSTASSEIQTATIAAYNISSTGQENILFIKNISKRQRIDQMHVVLRCIHAHPCFSPDPKTRDFALFHPISPTGLANSLFEVRDSDEIAAFISLPPGGRIAISVHRNSVDADPNVFLLPDIDSSKTLYFTKDTLFVTMADHYYDIISYGFVGGAGVLLIWIATLAALAATKAQSRRSSPIASAATTEIKHETPI